MNGSGPVKNKDAFNQNKDLSVIDENEKISVKAEGAGSNVATASNAPASGRQDGPKRSYL